MGKFGRSRRSNSDISLYKTSDLMAEAREAREKEEWPDVFGDGKDGWRQIVQVVALRRRPGQRWQVRVRRSKRAQDYAASGRRVEVCVAVADFSDFPTARQIESECSDEWGGGRYQIWATHPPRHIFTVEVPGESVNPYLDQERQEDQAAKVTAAGQKEAVEARQSALRAEFIREYLDRNPERKTELMPLIIGKMLGVEIKLGERGSTTPEAMEDDPAVLEYLERHPEANERVMAAQLAKLHGGRMQDWLPQKDKGKDDHPGLTPGVRRILKRIEDQAADQVAEEILAAGKRPANRGGIGAAVNDMLSRLEPDRLNRLLDTLILRATGTAVPLAAGDQSAPGQAVPAVEPASPQMEPELGRL